MNGTFGQSAGLNVVLPQQGGYAPATKEAIGAATGGNIEIPTYDVAQGMAETEPYNTKLAEFQKFLANARMRGVNPETPLIGNEESLTANQIYRKFISDINREGALLAEAKKTKGDLMRGGYETPAGMDNSAAALIQNAPNAMKKDAISPVASTFVRAIQNDTITADNVERYEAAREQAKAQVAGEAERLLAEGYNQGQVDQYISRSLAALDIPLNVKGDDQMTAAQRDASARGWAALRLQEQNAANNNNEGFEFGSTDEIAFNNPNLPEELNGGYSTVDGGSFYFDNDVDIIPTGKMFSPDGTPILDKDAYSWKSDRFVVVEVASPTEPLYKTQGIAGKPVNDKMRKKYPKLKTVKQGMFVAKGTDKKTNNQIIGYEPATSKDAINRGYSTAPRKKQAQESLERVLSGTTTKPTQTTQPATQETKTVSRATLRGLLGKAGYEGQTEQSLIDYYKENGYTIK
jgi:hypothetical protein